jgi:hypothetical protein
MPGETPASSPAGIEHRAVELVVGDEERDRSAGVEEDVMG